MQAQTLTPFQLFGNQVRYAVPMFQRPYVSTKELQWEPLWEDVRTLAERLIEQPATGSIAAGAVDVPPHFLGAIVLDQLLVPAGYIPVRHIIDGQQRLTTLQLLLDAAQLVMQSHGDPQDASALQTLILNNAAIAQGADDVFKVWPTNYDRHRHPRPRRCCRRRLGAAGIRWCPAGMGGRRRRTSRAWVVFVGFAAGEVTAGVSRPEKTRTKRS